MRSLSAEAGRDSRTALAARVSALHNQKVTTFRKREKAESGLSEIAWSKASRASE